MSARDEFYQELSRRVAEVATRMNIPVEYTSVFETVFITHVILGYVQDAFTTRAKGFRTDVKRLIDTLRGLLELVQPSLFRALRDLGSQSIPLEQFQREVEALKQFCDDYFDVS